MRKCGYTVPHKGKICPAKGQKCNRCGGEDHFSRFSGKNKEPAPTPSDKSKPGHVGHIRIAGINADRQLLTVKLEICPIFPAGQTAIITTAPGSEFQALVGGIYLLQPLGICTNELQRGKPGNLLAANGSSLSEIWRVRARIRLEQRECIINITICSDVNGLLLSWYDSIAMGILHPQYPKPVPVNSLTTIHWATVIAHHNK